MHFSSSVTGEPGALFSKDPADVLKVGIDFLTGGFVPSAASRLCVPESLHQKIQ